MNKICNHDCFNCIYDDCINDSYADYYEQELSNSLDYEIIKESARDRKINSYSEKQIQCFIYNQSYNGRKRNIRYEKTCKAKERQNKYNQSAKGKERTKKYNQSVKAIEARRRYEEKRKERMRLERMALQNV